VVYTACEQLAPYVLLLWEGLKMMFSSTALSLSTMKVSLFRGMRMTTEAYKSLCRQEGSFVVLPAFTSFSVDLAAALCFPAQGVTDPKTQVDVLLPPFSAMKVVSSTRAGPNGRPLIKLSDVEVLSPFGVFVSCVWEVCGMWYVCAWVCV
jgi:hypothetical protein